MTAASGLVAFIAFVLAPFLTTLADALATATPDGKVVVTPLTLTANYIFMRWLTNRTQRQQGPKDTS